MEGAIGEGTAREGVMVVRVLIWCLVLVNRRRFRLDWIGLDRIM